MSPEDVREVKATFREMGVDVEAHTHTHTRTHTHTGKVTTPYLRIGGGLLLCVCGGVVRRLALACIWG